MFYGVGHAYGLTRDRSLVGYNNIAYVNFDSSNELRANSASEQIHFEKNDASTALGYSAYADAGTGINTGLNISPSDSQASTTDSGHNHEDNVKRNSNGYDTKNGDTPFILPFP